MATTKSDTVKVLLSGTKPKFADEVRAWLKSEKLAVSVTAAADETRHTWVVCDVASNGVDQLHKKLSGVVTKPFFVDAVFPASVVSTLRASVIPGPARVAQEVLISELPPMTATPDTRRGGASSRRGKKPVRSSRATA